MEDSELIENASFDGMDLMSSKVRKCNILLTVDGSVKAVAATASGQSAYLFNNEKQKVISCEECTKIMCKKYEPKDIVAGIKSKLNGRPGWYGIVCGQLTCKELDVYEGSKDQWALSNDVAIGTALAEGTVKACGGVSLAASRKSAVHLKKYRNTVFGVYIYPLKATVKKFRLFQLEKTIFELCGDSVEADHEHDETNGEYDEANDVYDENDGEYDENDGEDLENDGEDQEDDGDDSNSSSYKLKH